MKGIIVDLFAGGGGASTGIEAALGRPVDVAINHSETALAVHRANHPDTQHIPSDIWEVDPFLATRGRPVDVLWASPDCTHHSRAKGGKPRSKKIRSLAHVVTQWARAVQPRCIFVENVQEFAEWGPLDEEGHPIKTRKGEEFARWCGELRLLGYSVDFRVLDASEYGAPTRRKRLFVVARYDGQPAVWPEPTHGPGLKPYRTAAECIDWSLPCPSIFERKRPLAEKTLWRVAQGIKRYVLEDPAPFLLKFQQNSVGQTIAEPMHTVMAGAQRFGMVSPTLIQTGYGEREGQAPRTLDIEAPLGTVVAGGQKHALVSAFMVKHFGGMVGFHPERAPTSTITAKDRLGLVTVEGTDYQIADIGLRMLQPHELLVAQFGEFAESYDMRPARTKSAQVRLIGNSVCPHVVAALVRENVLKQAREAA